MLRSIILIVLLISNITTIAQLTYSLDDDSAFIAILEKETNAVKNDSVKAYNFLKLSLYCKLIKDTVKAKAYLTKGTALSKKYPLLKGAAYYYQTHAQYGKIDIAFTENYLMKADSVLKNFQSEEAAKILVMVWHNFGIVQQMKGNEKAALEAFTTKAAYYAGKCNDAPSSGKVNKAIGIISMNANERTKAATYLKQSVFYYEKPSADNPTRLDELVDTYIIAAENYAYMGLPDSAKPFLDKAAKILAPHPNSNLYLRFYFAEGTYYNKTKQYANALKSFKKGIILTNEPASLLSINRLKLGLYNTYMSMKDYRNAIALVEELLQSPYLAEQDRVKYYKELYNGYALAGDTKKSLQWAQKYITLQDSLHESGVQKDILELERKYNDAENKRQIGQLQAEKDKAIYTSKNNRLLNWLLGIISLFLLVLFFIGRLYFKNAQKLSAQKEINYRQQLQEAEQRQQAAFAKALLDGEEKERKRLAGDLHDGLGGMLSGVKMNLSRLVNNNKENTMNNDLYKVIDQLDISVRELRRIAHNMMPESLLQFGLEESLKDLCHQCNTPTTKVVFQAFHLNNEISKDVQATIYRIVQELVTNALRHANASEIFVQCSQSDDKFLITVEDNGKGFDANAEKKHKGIGLLNIRRRVEYLNGKFEIASEAGEGTDINIEFHVPAK